MISEGLKAHLRDLGRWDDDGNGRTAKPRVCPACRAWTLTGLDADVMGLPVRVDTKELDQLGVFLAVCEGRYLVKLNRRRGHPGKVQLDTWSPQWHTLRDADVILAEHRHATPQGESQDIN